MGLRGPTVASFRRNIVRVVWWIGIVWSSAAVAQETEADNAAEVALGEHNRLSVELQTLAQRGAWAGVERTFLRLVSTGIEPDFDDWVVGAASARARGDMKATNLLVRGDELLLTDLDSMRRFRNAGRLRRAHERDRRRFARNAEEAPALAELLEACGFDAPQTHSCHIRIESDS